MKRLFFFISLLSVFFAQAASLESLKGSYAGLPEELRELSLLDGAIALETGMLERLYNAEVVPSLLQQESIRLIKKLFSIIPANNNQPQVHEAGFVDGQFRLSKGVADSDGKKNKLLKNLLILWLIKIVKNREGIAIELKETAISDLKSLLVRDHAFTATLFKDADTDIAVTALKGVFWAIKNTIVEKEVPFQHEDQLKMAWKSLKEILEKKFPRQEGVMRKLIAQLDPLMKLLKSASSEYQPEEITENAIINIAQQDFTPESYEQFAVGMLKLISGDAYHPKALNQSEQNLKVVINGKEINFVDCVETLIRNLINILAYDRETRSFRPEALKEKFKDLQPELFNFYKAYPSMEQQRTWDARIAWESLVSNIQGVTYNHTDKDNSHEITGSYSNLIIALNHLLGMGWFDELTEPPKNMEDFAREHIDKLISLFGKLKTREDSKITIKSVDEKYVFYIHVYAGHGYMKYERGSESIKICKPNMYTAYPQLYNLMLWSSWPQVPSKLIHLFSQPIEDLDFCAKIIKEMKVIPYSWIPQLQKFLGKHTTDNMSKVEIINMYLKVIADLESQKEYQEYRNELITSAFDVAKKYCTDTGEWLEWVVWRREDPVIAFWQSQSVSYQALKLFIALVKKDKGFAEAISAAGRGIKDKDSFRREAALQLFIALFDKDKGFEEAINAAARGIEDKDSSVRSDALKLFIELVKKDKGFAEAISAAVRGIGDERFFVRKAALELFIELVKKGEGITEAVEAAVRGIADKDAYDREPALGLFIALFDKDKGFEEAINAAVRGIKDKDSSVCSDALKLFIELVKKDKGFAEAVEAAVRGIEDKDSSVRKAALELFKELVKKGEGIPEAINAAARGIGDKYSSVCKAALELFIELVKKDKGIPEAVEAAKRGLQDNVNDNKELAERLNQLLLEKKPDSSDVVQHHQEQQKMPAFDAIQAVTVTDDSFKQYIEMGKQFIEKAKKPLLGGLLASALGYGMYKLYWRFIKNPVVTARSMDAGSLVRLPDSEFGKKIRENFSFVKPAPVVNPLF